MTEAAHWDDKTGRRLKLQDLRVLMAVQEAGSMGKAAQALFTSQPAVSRSIADLEAVVGARLLERHRRGVAPTEHGRALLECAAAVFDDLRQGFNRIESLSDPTAGEVRIGCNPFLAAGFVAAAVDRMNRRHPRVVSHLVVAPSKTLMNELWERRVDVLITRDAEINTDRVMFNPLFKDSYVIAVGTRHHLARRRSIALTELAAHPWTLPPPESAIGKLAGAVFRASGCTPEAKVISIATDVRINLLLTGRFLTIVPASALRFPTLRSDIKALPVTLPGGAVANGVVSLRGRALSPSVETFLNFARDLGRTMVAIP